MGTLPDKLIELLGTGRKAPVKVGDLVPKWDGAEEYTPVEAIYRDFLGNECWISAFGLEHVKESMTQKEYAKHITLEAEETIGRILQDSDYIYHDTNKNAVIYVKKLEGLFYNLVVGIDTLKKGYL